VATVALGSCRSAVPWYSRASNTSVCHHGNGVGDEKTERGNGRDKDKGYMWCFVFAKAYILGVSSWLLYFHDLSEKLLVFFPSPG